MKNYYLQKSTMDGNFRLIGAVSFIFILGISYSFSQSFEGGWRVTGSAAIQEQDRRLFGDTDKILGREILLHEEQNYSYDLALALHKSILHRHDFRLDLGLGYRQEFNTFSRSFEHHYFASYQGIHNEILITVKRYNIHQLFIPLTLQYKLFRFGESGIIFLGGSIEGGLHFAKSVRSEGPWYFSRLDIAPYSLEVNPGIGIKIGSWSGMVNYRAYHKRQIDEVIFYSDLFPPWLYDEVPTGYETYNPFKMWITVSRDLEEGWWRRKK